MCIACLKRSQEHTWLIYAYSLRPLMFRSSEYCLRACAVSGCFDIPRLSILNCLTTINVSNCALAEQPIGAFEFWLVQIRAEAHQPFFLKDSNQYCFLECSYHNQELLSIFARMRHLCRFRSQHGLAGRY